MNRLSDWSERLTALITAAEHRPFNAVRWNCGRFARAAVVACTGQLPSWQHRPTLAEMADTAGFSRLPVPFAGAGDVVLAADPERLGVVLDAGRAASVGPAGLLRLPIRVPILMAGPAQPTGSYSRATLRASVPTASITDVSSADRSGW